MIDCPCGYGKDIQENQGFCPVCGTDVTPLHRLKALPGLYYEQGIALREQGCQDSALEKVTVAVCLDQSFGAAHKLLGDLLVQKGSFARGLNHYARAAALEGESEDLTEAIHQAETLQQQRRNDPKRKLVKSGRSLVLRLISVAVAAFLAGLLIAPLSKKLPVTADQSEAANPPQVTATSQALLAEMIRDRIRACPGLRGISVTVNTTPQGISISGQVPGELHTYLIAALAQGAEPDHPVDMSQLTTAAPPPPPKRETCFRYTVKSGDNLSLIADRFFGDGQQWPMIFAVNQETVDNPRKLIPGQSLKIPFMSSPAPDSDKNG